MDFIDAEIVLKKEENEIELEEKESELDDLLLSGLAGGILSPRKINPSIFGDRLLAMGNEFSKLGSNAAKNKWWKNIFHKSGPDFNESKSLSKQKVVVYENELKGKKILIATANKKLKNMPDKYGIVLVGNKPAMIDLDSTLHFSFNEKFEIGDGKKQRGFVTSRR